MEGSSRQERSCLCFFGFFWRLALSSRHGGRTNDRAGLPDEVESLGYFCRMRALRGAFAHDANAGTTGDSETKAISANGVAWWSLVGACLRQSILSRVVDVVVYGVSNMIQSNVKRLKSQTPLPYDIHHKTPLDVSGQ